MITEEDKAKALAWFRGICAENYPRGIYGKDAADCFNLINDILQPEPLQIDRVVALMKSEPQRGDVGEAIKYAARVGSLVYGGEHFNALIQAAQEQRSKMSVSKEIDALRRWNKKFKEENTQLRAKLDMCNSAFAGQCKVSDELRARIAELEKQRPERVTVENLAGDMVNALYDYRLCGKTFGDSAAKIIIYRLLKKHPHGLLITEDK